MDRAGRLNAALLDHLVLAQVNQHDIAQVAQRGAVFNGECRSALDGAVGRSAQATRRHVDQLPAGARWVEQIVKLGFYVLVEDPDVITPAQPAPRPHLRDVLSDNGIRCLPGLLRHAHQGAAIQNAQRLPRAGAVDDCILGAKGKLLGKVLHNPAFQRRCIGQQFVGRVHQPD